MTLQLRVHDVGVVIDYADMVLTVGIVSNYMDTVSAYSQDYADTCGKLLRLLKDLKGTIR